MPTVRSRDGTTIAFEKTGSGPAVILVDGALCSRAMGPMPELAPLLAPAFTVYTYDRRGRNQSGDTQPYAIDREIEDLGALIQEAGGSAFVYGSSSGAALAVEAANRLHGITKLALFEAPFFVDDTRDPIPDDYEEKVRQAIAADRRGEAVSLFMKLVGVPGPAILMMRLMPMWSKLKAMAHTLPYDAAIMAGRQSGKPLPPDQWPHVMMPTLVFGGEKSPTWMQHAVKALTDNLPNAKQRILKGQTHMVKASVVAPELIAFFREG